MNLFRNPVQFNDSGLDKLNSQNYIGAITELSKAIEIDERFYEAYAWRGKAYFLSEQFELAIKDFNQVLLLTSKFYKLNPLFYRGCCKLQLRDFIGAIVDFDKALIYASFDEFDIYLNRSIANHELKKYLLCIDDLNKAITVGTDSFYKMHIYNKSRLADAFYCRGLAKEKTGDFLEAIEDYSEAIKYNPIDKNAYSDRAELYAEIGEFELALLDIKTINEIENNV